MQALPGPVGDKRQVRDLPGKGCIFTLDVPRRRPEQSCGVADTLAQMTRTVAALLATTVAGCGLTMTRGADPHQPRDQRPTCTESMQAPMNDAYGAILGLGTMVVGALFVDAGDNADVGVPLIVGGAVVTAASYASGGIGYFRVKRCRKAISEFEQRTSSSSTTPDR
jgi:hypothetical protein